MSTRNAFPKARLPQSHYFITFARGDDARCIAVRPWVLYAVGAVFPVCALIYLAASLIFVMRDDMLAGLMHRQSAMQVAYEDRLANMRMQLDRVTSSQLLDQNSLEARMHDLLSRQARLESRSAVVATLADGAGITTTTRAPTTPAAAPAANPLIQNAERPLPSNAMGYAPVGGPALLAPGFRQMPRPGAVEVQPSSDSSSKANRGASLLDPAAAQIAGDRSLPPELRLGALAQSLDRIEFEQVRSVGLIANRARQAEVKLRQAISATGLPVDKLATAPASGAQNAPAMGGPFVPFKLDPNGSPFEKEVLRMQNYVASADRLRRVASRLPLRKPLAGDPEVTSGFGSRIDPFNGRLAAHTGIDFRQAYGSPVRATAAGTVVSAGPHGGYGNSVDVDHGNGVTTRYAHLSAIIVKTGQTVAAGTILGRLGSSGRSTGPHLHYEVRHNDQPLDPRRFLAAGQHLASN